MAGTKTFADIFLGTSIVLTEKKPDDDYHHRNNAHQNCGYKPPHVPVVLSILFCVSDRLSFCVRRLDNPPLFPDFIGNRSVNAASFKDSMNLLFSKFFAIILGNHLKNAVVVPLLDPVFVIFSPLLTELGIKLCNRLRLGHDYLSRGAGSGIIH